MTTTTTNEITNFMGGKSFNLFNPLKRAELIAFSSFLGEPTFYQPTDELDRDIRAKSTERQRKLKTYEDHLLYPLSFSITPLEFRHPDQVLHLQLPLLSLFLLLDNVLLVKFLGRFT